MTTSKGLGLYIHIPFCAKKCRYCDFTSYAVADEDTHLAYTLKLIFEIRAKRALIAGGPGDAMVDTIYIGGGTPSLLEAGLIQEILDAVYSTYMVKDDAEITLEANPGTAGYEKFRAYRAAGVNRLSIGAQSFGDETLSFLGRIHHGADAVRAFGDARAAGFDNVSLDLIFGVPGQGFSGWERDLRAAVALEPEHISFYGLQIEEGTPLFESRESGDFEEVSDIEDRKMYRFAKEYLTGRGLYHYEISNSARPGFESRHNLKYWSMAPYIGFGAGAHSFFGGRRFSNKPELALYLAAEDERDMADRSHDNTLSDDMSEYIFLGLRRTAGIDLGGFSEEFGRDFWELYGEETEKLIGRGLLEKSGQNLRLTALGLDLANTVFTEYV